MPATCLSVLGALVHMLACGRARWRVVDMWRCLAAPTELISATFDRSGFEESDGGADLLFQSSKARILEFEGRGGA